MTTFTEALGARVGRMLAPLTRTGSRLRHARLFHPEGIVLRGRCEALDDERLAHLAGRFEGPVLVRFSTAVWRGGREYLDVLGLSVRFRSSDEVTTEAAPGDQDVLFATIRHPLTTVLAALTTEVHDFLENDYYGVSPFTLPEAERVWLRVSGPRPDESGATRTERLLKAVANGTAVLLLEVKLERGGPYLPVARIVLEERAAVDQETLRFWPYRDGRQLRPRGFVHALRLATYRESQHARPSSSA